MPPISLSNPEGAGGGTGQGLWVVHYALRVAGL